MYFIYLFSPWKYNCRRKWMDNSEQDFQLHEKIHRFEFFALVLNEIQNI